ncbi:hypothetical protein Agub_g494, partial [Astrephomene gubernaculifera]
EAAAAVAAGGAVGGNGAGSQGPRVSAKIRVRLDASRRVFGVADPSLEWADEEADPGGCLQPASCRPLRKGECFFQPLVDGQPKSLVGGKVVMIRNPCYDAGDIRVLSAVAPPS